jgi:acyl dehydratase
MAIKNLDKILIGLHTEHRKLEYTWRDLALYALAVGADENDLSYTYERNMKALPTFGVIPYWGALNVEPRISRPQPAAVLAEPIIQNTIAPLHMEHALLLHRPIDPIKGTFVYQDVITDVFDRGEGKGAVIKTKAEVYDEAGNLVCTNISSTLYQQAGGFGGPALPPNPLKMPDRQPDIEVNDFISKVQNLLYRLSGDTNLVHADPDYAREKGFERVFMQGLCSFGFACRLAIKALIPGEPERVSGISAQMRSIVYPGTPVTLALWKNGPGEALFKLLNQDTGAAVLDRGVFRWK